ncbi:MAG: IclR family transcriptional regulator [Desulfobacterales bacterium]|jgi:DNA-binding IclR family transcriptional regulator
MRTSVKTHQTVEKALCILLEFIPHNQPMGTADLSLKLNLHKSTVNRMLHVLRRFEFLEQDPQSKKFSLGKAANELGKALNRSYAAQLVAVAGPHIDELCHRLQETVVLEVLSGNSTILAYVAEGPGPIYVREAAGERRPVHASAGGKLLLAFSSEETRNRYLNGNLPSITSKTVTDFDDLHARLNKIRQQGYATDDEEVHVGIRAVAAPVFSRNQKIIAAAVVTGLVQKISITKDSAIIANVCAAAAEISYQLGNENELRRKE